ncbi:MAG TPA: DUF2157 domain-containing protein [Candidatus Acidoferrum sp.]|nr:DUF2157 domain-containing protein [Candidatus Acidoferrum sp.]
MTWRDQLEVRVERWIEAGLVDAKTAERILQFESAQERRAALRWPVFLAMVFGGILFAAGITLFVAAHWSDLSPAMRFSLLLLMLGVCHLGGAASAARFPALSTTLHGVGTVTLGAAIFLAAQIFNLHENWATGVLLWAIGAVAGYLLLRSWVQAAALALLVPAWLISQWSTETEWHSGGERLLAVGLILTALCYLSARIAGQESASRRTLVWIGGIALLPCVAIAIAIVIDNVPESYVAGQNPPLSSVTLAVGWTVALLAPLVLAWFLRGPAAWMNVVCAAWAYALILAASYSRSFGPHEYHQSLLATLALYALLAIGSAGLVVWGLYEKRKERLNLGIAGFAISVLFFYFDSFMGKLGRSASLLILGVLCLLGGYVLEITRRKLMARMEMSR